MITQTRADILIHAPNGWLVALVEVWNRLELTTEDAMWARRNLAERGGLPPVDYALVVSQDTGYLWRGTSVVDLDAPPDFTFNMRPVVERFFRDRSPGQRLYHGSLVTALYIWLSDLASNPQAPADEIGQSLSAIGFLDAIRRADIAPPIE